SLRRERRRGGPMQCRASRSQSTSALIARSTIPRPGGRGVGGAGLIHPARGGAALELVELVAGRVELGAELLDFRLALPQAGLHLGELEEETADLHHEPGRFRRLRLGARLWWSRRLRWQRRL